MKRKLIKQGIGGQTIYLPKKWVDLNNLDSDDYVTVDVIDNNLLISAESISQKTSLNLAIEDDTETSIRTKITNAYRNGYDSVFITYSNETQLKHIKKVVSARLPGYELTDYGKSRCTIQCISETSEEQFEIVFGRYLHNVSFLFEQAKLTFRGKSTNLDEVESSIQKYDNYCKRIVSRSKFRHKKSGMLLTLFSLITHAQRELYHATKQKPSSPELLILLQHCEDCFNLLKKSILGRNTKLFDSIHSLQIEKIGEFHDQASRMKGNDAIAVLYLTSCFRQFYLACSPLLGWLI